MALRGLLGVLAAAESANQVIAGHLQQAKDAAGQAAAAAGQAGPAPAAGGQAG